jgi:hypothetical protein
MSWFYLFLRKILPAVAKKCGTAAKRIMPLHKAAKNPANLPQWNLLLTAPGLPISWSKKTHGLVEMPGRLSA